MQIVFLGNVHKMSKPSLKQETYSKKFLLKFLPRVLSIKVPVAAEADDILKFYSF